MQNYDLLIEKIALLSGLEKEEIERRVEVKKQKLSGLISKEGAAQIIAAELRISFEEADLTISELIPGLKKVNLIGKIISLFPIREYNKDGRNEKVANFIIADETGSTKIVLWDTKHISLIEDGKIKQGDVIEVKNGSTRENEVHLSGFSELKKSNKKIENVKVQFILKEKSLEEVRQGDNVNVRGVVVQIFQPRFYNVCPHCNKKVINEGEYHNCLEHGIVKAKERAILNFVLDDSTNTMRIVMFSDQINSLIPEEDLRKPEKAVIFRNDFLGTEIYISGIVKKNQLFNNLEIVANSVERVDADKLIEKLGENSIK